MTKKVANELPDSPGGLPEWYQQYIREQGYDKLERLDHEETIPELIVAGNRLLELEEEAKNPKPVVTPPKDESRKLNDAFDETSKNPYIKARTEILKKINPKLRETIEKMEKENNLDNDTYKNFIASVTKLGDDLSTNN